MRRDELLAEVAEPAVVEPVVAYRAAEDRAVRVTRALILAEAQVEHWKRMYVGAMGAAEDHWRPTDAGPPEFVCPHTADRHPGDVGPELPDATD